ncbi:MAG: hypothetical protein H0Z32_07465 [Bacillaceae bacterium]|nr:hypothetical protein [Bacillaceae bacterium]
MKPFLIDFILLAVLVVGFTAFLAVIPQKIGETFFSRGQKNKFSKRMTQLQANWPEQTREK